MSDDTRVVSGTVIVGAVLGVLCCAAPLIGALVLSDLAVVFASTGRVLTIALVGVLAMVALLLLRDVRLARSASPEGAGDTEIDNCCPPADGATIRLPQ